MQHLHLTTHERVSAGGKCGAGDSGDEVGSLTIEVAQNGYISVTKVSQFSTENSFVSGMVRDDGALQSVTLQSGFTLRGNLKTKSGTWKMGDWAGNWSVTKQ